MARVVVGLSGGVDSSVAAHLLMEEGHEVIGIFMRNWHDESVILHDECPWVDDSNDAMLLADRLGIPFQVIDLSIDYKDRIVNYMFNEYEQGRTPNPDVLCNREIKFDLFLKAATSLGADYVATGHYCRREVFQTDNGERFRLKAGFDQGKDQSYFLCQLNQEQLSKALFPIGHLQKSEVRAIAKANDFENAGKKDSQGLCFIGKVKLPIFLQQQLSVKHGDIVKIEGGLNGLAPIEKRDYPQHAAPYALDQVNSERVGQHDGAHFFTIGQRKGLQVGGMKAPLFVVGTDVKENIVYVGEGEEHWALYRKALFIQEHELHWVDDLDAMQVDEKRSYLVRIRYRQPLQEATLIKKENGMLIEFEQAQRGVACGQFAAWYTEDQLVGSGVISV